MNPCRLFTFCLTDAKTVGKFAPCRITLCLLGADEILSEHAKKDWKMRPGKMEMRWIGVVDDDGNVIGRYVSISDTSTGGFPRVPATQIWQHDLRTNTVHWQEAPKPFAKKAVRMWLEQKGVRAERHVPISGQM